MQLELFSLLGFNWYSHRLILFSPQLLKTLKIMQFSLTAFLLCINKHLGKLYQTWHHLFFFLHTLLDCNVKITLLTANSSYLTKFALMIA